MNFSEAVELAVKALDNEALKLQHVRDAAVNTVVWATLHEQMRSRMDAIQKLYHVREHMRQLHEM